MTLAEVLDQQDEIIKEQADIIRGLSLLLLQAGVEVDFAPRPCAPNGGE